MMPRGRSKRRWWRGIFYGALIYLIYLLGMYHNDSKEYIKGRMQRVEKDENVSIQEPPSEKVGSVVDAGDKLSEIKVIVQSSDPPPVLPERPAATPVENVVIEQPEPVKQVAEKPQELDKFNLSNDTVPANHPRAKVLKPYYPDVYDSDILQIRKVITEINFHGRVYNSEIFARDDEKDPAFVIQTHNRASFLKILLYSLSKVEGIERALLIISSDLYDRGINEVVATIDFCQYQHIFYPFAASLFPNQFPGTDPKDCPRDLPKHEAIQQKCNNAEFPDQYNHYREAKFVQLKHHWFWKLQYVFKIILPSSNTQSSVILLEDDYYISPDILRINAALRARELELHPQKKPFDLISLGNYEKKQYSSLEAWKAVQYQVDVQTFYASAHNMGMSLTRKTFSKIHRCRKQFCTYDDYNWDWTLQSCITSCMTNSFKTLVSVAPRVFHLGACTGPEGAFHTNKKTKACDLAGMKTKYEKYTEAIHAAENPTFKLRRTSDPKRKALKPNGGWGDPRDHALCMDYNLENLGS